MCFSQCPTIKFKLHKIFEIKKKIKKRWYSKWLLSAGISHKSNEKHPIFTEAYEKIISTQAGIHYYFFLFSSNKMVGLRPLKYLPALTQSIRPPPNMIMQIRFTKNNSIALSPPIAVKAKWMFERRPRRNKREQSETYCLCTQKRMPGFTTIISTSKIIAVAHRSI